MTKKISGCSFSYSIIVADNEAEADMMADKLKAISSKNCIISRPLWKDLAFWFVITHILFFSSNPKTPVVLLNPDACPSHGLFIGDQGFPTQVLYRPGGVHIIVSTHDTSGKHS